MMLVKQVADWLYDQNARELSDGTIVCFGRHDAHMIARLILDGPRENTTVAFAELLCQRLEAKYAAERQKGEG